MLICGFDEVSIANTDDQDKARLAAYLRAEFGKEDDINPSLCLSCENKIYFADPDGSVEVCTGYKPEPPKESKQNE